MLSTRLILPESLRASSIDFEYRGARAHYAPSSETPLSRAMLGKTNCAVITLIAGMNLLVAHRLERVADVRLLVQLAEVLLCFERAPEYYSGYHQESPTPDRNSAESVITGLFSEGTAVFASNPGKHSSFPPTQALKNTAALAELVFGKQHRAYLAEFLNAAVAQLGVVASNPNQVFTRKSDYATRSEWEEAVRRNFGTPVPIEAVGAGQVLSVGDLASLYQSFLNSVDWQANPYLRSADQMIDLGFIGDPYTKESL